MKTRKPDKYVSVVDTMNDDGNRERLVRFYLTDCNTIDYADGVHYIGHKSDGSLRLDYMLGEENLVKLRDGERRTVGEMSVFTIYRCGYWILCRFNYQRAKTFGEIQDEIYKEELEKLSRDVYNWFSMAMWLIIGIIILSVICSEHA